MVSTILKVMAQLQMLYSEWLDKDLVSWILVRHLPQPLAELLGFGPTIAYCLWFNIGAIILRPDKYNNVYTIFFFQYCYVY